MTILPSPASLLLRQVRLIISPPTSTLFESRAILSEVQSKFGSISTFINQRYDPVLRQHLKSEPSPTSSSQSPSQTILAVFDRPSSKDSAIGSDPFTIVCGGDLVPSADELDPYNARGLHGRHHPPKRTFSCHIVEEEDPAIHQRLDGQHPYTGPFRVDTLQLSYGDLVKAGGAPKEVKEMADVMQTERVPIDDKHLKQRKGCEDELHGVPSRYFYSASDRREDPQLEGGLMAAWRRSIEKEKTEEESQRWDGTEPASRLH
ncbi:hypothetical protein EPUS_02359 [Endocarpon pusillum Z07020]|uniref:Uncharacterized protein n=1 Tax=Endocarpon pusillum (strain Z07020 / HMAS-L-300199) TaxID=1263415 RepID=U1G0U1_ENDPU|nr:uncharacterized protein EPUS_02359 [Endocarpon pusillum Z07020]ERF70837.1 hypothetical protein EPUS_02359 [Endocarpon pusillum Z07020]